MQQIDVAGMTQRKQWGLSVTTEMSVKRIRIEMILPGIPSQAMLFNFGQQCSAPKVVLQMISVDGGCY